MQHLLKVMKHLAVEIQQLYLRAVFFNSLPLNSLCDKLNNIKGKRDVKYF